MKPYKKAFQKLYQFLDIKPFGKWKRALKGKERMDNKKEIRKQVKDMNESK